MSQKEIVLVCGGRYFKKKDFIHSKLNEENISCLVHGGAEGVDSLAGEWAILHKIPEIIVPAQWGGYGRSAGPVRNKWMIEFIPITLVIAFPGQAGTANMVSQAKKAGVKVKEVRYERH